MPRCRRITRSWRRCSSASRSARRVLSALAFRVAAANAAVCAALLSNRLRASFDINAHSETTAGMSGEGGAAWIDTAEGSRWPGFHRPPGLLTMTPKLAWRKGFRIRSQSLDEQLCSKHVKSSHARQRIHGGAGPRARRAQRGAGHGNKMRKSRMHKTVHVPKVQGCFDLAVLRFGTPASEIFAVHIPGRLSRAAGKHTRNLCNQRHPRQTIPQCTFNFVVVLRFAHSKMASR